MILLNLHRIDLPLILTVCLIILACGAGSIWATEFPRDAEPTPQETPYDDELTQAFDLLRAVGEAGNSGTAGEEAARQTCALVQSISSRALTPQIQSFVDDRVNAPSWAGSFIPDDLGMSSVSSQAINAACATLSGQDARSPSISVEAIRTYGLQMAMREGAAALKSSGLPFTTRMEIETGVDDGDPYWQALSVQPLWHDKTERLHLLAQASWNHSSDKGDVLNTGLALRRLNEARTIVFGANAFFDHAARMNHNRMSVGADVQTSTFGGSINRYIPLSGWKSVDAFWEERASQGWDAELQGRHPDWPEWEASFKGYTWSGNDNGTRDKVFGVEAGLE